MLFRRRIMGLVLGLAIIISALTAYSKEIEWTKVSVPSAKMLRSVAISSDASVIYISDDEGGLYKSTTDGNTWTKLNPPLEFIGMNPYQIVCSSDGSIVYMVNTNSSLLKSSNYGSTWSVLEVEVYNIAISDDGNIIYRTDGGQLFKSSDGGSHWTELIPPRS